MPEFIMEGRDHAARAESPFVYGFIEAMFFTECSPAYCAEEWFSDECKAAVEAGQSDGSIPGDVGYTDLHPDGLKAIRAFCSMMQGHMHGLLLEAYSAHWKNAAMSEGWSRNRHNGYFIGPVGHETRMADYESWRELCECEGIEPGEEYDETQAGRDLFYTYVGHGVGYWDREQLKRDGLGNRLSDECGRGEISPFFGGHATYGDAPFVHVEGL